MTYLNCATCLSDDPRQPGRLTQGDRARWRCGFLGEHEREPRSIRNDPPDWGVTRTDVCPGYLIQLPQVCEAARAHTVFDKGQPMEKAYPDCDVSIDGLLMASVLELNQALGEAESEALARLDRK